MLKKSLWRAGLAVIPAIVLGYAGFALWQAWWAERESGRRVASEGQIAFRSVRLGGTPPAGFEWIGAPAVFNDAREYRGHVYVSGPAGLFDYDAGGALVSRFRPGLELPGAPLVALAVGAAADASEPELFIATAGEGLLAFDGRSFRQIVANDPAYRTLTAVLPLGTGRILFGTPKKGVLVYDGRTITPFHRTLSDLNVTALAGDEASLWVGTLGGGVLHWHSGEVERFSEAEGLADPQVLSIALSGDAAYIGTPLGVAEFRGGRFTRSLAAGLFARTLLVRGDRLIIGTFDEGIVETPLAVNPPRGARAEGVRSQESGFREEKRTSAISSSVPDSRLPTPDSFGPSHVERLVEINGAVYAVAEDGLYAGNQGEWRRVVERESAVLAGRNIAALGVDNSGKLWVGYFDRGLDIVEAGWERARHLEDEHLFCVNRIVFDPHPASVMAAVATANGLVLFDAAARPRQVLGKAQGLIADHVTDVALDSGRLIVATPAGLTFIDEGGARSMYAFHGLVNNHVYALASSGAHLLAGTLGGMSVLEGGVVRASYTTVNSGLRHNWITAIAPVDSGWFVGTYGAGILKLDASGRWESFADATDRFEVNPGAMLATERHVYAGTLRRGLYVYDRASGRWSVITAGLPSKNVTALAAGGGYVYIGTDNGLVRVLEEMR